MVGVGEQVGRVSLWTAPGEQRSVAELLGERGALFFFYLFDWSST